jgi:digeranylgeranylglycerophospholipid reductase
LKRQDVIVVGAGSAGCVTARRCAELGLHTLLLDRKPKNKVGQKVCGDEISKSHFEATGINVPSGKEVSSVIDGADVYPPSMMNELKVRGWSDFDGWTVDRLAFGQRLLNEAIKAGVKFLPNVHVAEPTLIGDQVTGVHYRDISTREETTVKSKLVVDASGFAAVIRNKLDSPLVENHIDKNDIALCYREILKLKVPLAEPEVARVFLGGKIAPQGYAWIFPKGVQEVNAGVGIRPLKSLVGNGVAFVGDAALQVNPIHGGGIGAGIRAGIILGEVARESIARRNLTAKGLWTYNTRYLPDFGNRLASLEIFRRLLQGVTDEDLDFGFEKRLLEAEDLMSANKGDGLSLGITDKMRRVKRGAGRVSLLLKLQKAASLMKKISKAYSAYPSDPSGLENWEKQVLNIIEDANFE